MASIPETSASSSGGGNQPPNKRTRMEIASPNGHLESGQLSLLSDQPGSVSCVMIVQQDHLKCLLCQEYPRKEVYQCDGGHIVCHSCIVKITRCPVCRVLYPQKKIRSLVAETDLDGMGFNCSFRNSGCLIINIPRNRRTAHEIQCDFNPNKPGFKFCSMFDFTKACQFRIDPNAILQDLQHTKDVIKHLTVPPHKLIQRRAQIGHPILLRFRIPATLKGVPFEPVVLIEVFNGTTRKTIGFYLLILRLSMPGRQNLSWAVVGLNCAPVDLNGGNRHSDKITVTFSMEAKTDPNKLAKDGEGCVPNLSWKMKSTYLDEWDKFMMTPIEDRPPFSFAAPLSFLSEYYNMEDDKYEMSVTFGPLVG